MPIRTNPKNPAARARARRSAIRTAVPAFQEPRTDPEVVPEPDRPVEHNGIAIEREEPVPSPLPGAAPFKYSRLMLADGGSAFACRDCLFTGDTRGDVMAHRNAEHGARYGKRRPKVVYEPDDDITDLVLPPRADGPAPDALLEMTIGEHLAIAPTIKALGDLIDRLEQERDELAEQLKTARIDKSTQHKIDVYESHRQEILELRGQLNRQANYEALRNEVLELRGWKRKITHQLSRIGFKLDEEE
jgi:hypothetical protein